MLPLATSTEMPPALPPPTALMLLVELATRLPAPVTSMSTLPPDVLTSPLNVMPVPARKVTAEPPVLQRAVDPRVSVPLVERRLTVPVPAPPVALKAELAVSTAPLPESTRLKVPPEVVMELLLVLDETAVTEKLPPEVVTELPTRESAPVRFKVTLPPPVLRLREAFCVKLTPVAVKVPPPVFTSAACVVEPPPELSELALQFTLTGLSELDAPL